MIYTGYETITLVGSLYSLRVAMRIHGRTPRTEAIERAILAELHARGRTDVK